jgi:hypothetical protein
VWTRNSDLKALVILAKTPQWIARLEGCPDKESTDQSRRCTFPNHVAEWEEFVRDMVRLVSDEFPGLVIAWELWNEPHSNVFWNGSAAHYRDQVLIPGYRALKEANASAFALGLGGYGYADVDDWGWAGGSCGRWENGGCVTDVLQL